MTPSLSAATQGDKKVIESECGVLLLAFSAALNPTLLAATTVMLLLPRPRNLMLGYLLGAMMTSVSLGMVIVFSFERWPLSCRVSWEARRLWEGESGTGLDEVGRWAQLRLRGGPR